MIMVPKDIAKGALFLCRSPGRLSRAREMIDERCHIAGDKQ